MRLRGINESEVDVWPAFTDFVTSVLFIVVLFIFGIFFSNIARSLLASDSTFRAMQARIEEVQKGLTAIRGVDVKVDGNIQYITLHVDEQGVGGVLFDVGQAVLKEPGKQRIDEIVNVLRRYRGSYKTIEVVGHADSQRLGDTRVYASNWELSAARAGAVVNHILSRQAHLPDDQQIEPWRFSANGSGEYRPYDIDSKEFSNRHTGRWTAPPDDTRHLPDYVLEYNRTPELQLKNRRIEIVLTYSLVPSNDLPQER